MPAALSVIVPVYNESSTLARVVSDLERTLESANVGEFEIIVVDDGSNDGSAKMIPSDVNHTYIISNAKRLGSGAARKMGSRRAKGRIVAWIDGDGTYSAASLVTALDCLGDADQTIGARTTDFGRVRLLRLWVKKVTSAVAGFLWMTPISDLNSGLRVFRREKLMVWLDELPNGFSCTTTATLAAINHRQTIAFVDINYSSRSSEGTSKFHPIWDTFRLWRTVWRMWRKKSARTRC